MGKGKQVGKDVISSVTSLSMIPEGVLAHTGYQCCPSLWEEG